MTVHPEQLGRYRLISLIGEGGMGKVYKGFDATLERNVAIKILPPELVSDASRVARFVQEARAASALNHPHVVAVYDIGEEQNTRYIAMELIDGKTLRELTSGEPLEIRKALRVVLQVAEALIAAHLAGIIHRDLKPENIMVTSAGYAKVLDFGLAKLRFRDDPESATMSRTVAKETDPGMVMGTVGYMSPEQALGKPIDFRSDIFSLGCILYELATSRRAFRGDSSVDTLHKIIYTEPEPIRSARADIPPDLVRIVRKALAKDPEERYQSVKDLAIDLRDLLREIDTNPRGTSVLAATPRAPQRRWLIPALLAILIAAAALVAVFRPAKNTADAPSAQSSMRISRVTANGKVISAAISRDGAYVAYVISDQGEQSLWVRQTSSGQSLQLIPPRRVAFWGTSFAPDGSIYYGMKDGTEPAGAIYQISTLGGSPRKIFREIDSQPTFSPDGKRFAILRASFPTSEESALIVANSDGSSPRVLAKVRAPEFFVPVFFAGASWSPDGKLIAASLNNASAPAKMVAFDVETGAMKTITESSWKQAYHVEWLPDQKGLVAVVQGANDVRNQVWFVPYPAGTPSRITNDLFDYRSVSVTADGKSILTIASDAAADLWILPDGAPPMRIKASKYEGGYGIATLPDGRIVSTSTESGKIDLWIMNGDGGERTQLTRDQHENRVPVATPDGRSIVYFSSTAKQNEICRINIDGTDRRVIATTINQANLDVSPDGKWIAFEAPSGPGRNIPTFYRVPIDGGKPEQLTSLMAFIPAFSPDGSKIAGYFRPSLTSTGFLGVIPSAGGEPLHRLKVAPPFFRSGLSWTPDGKSLFVNTAPSDRANLWQVPLDGSAPRKLTNFDEHNLFAFAPLRTGKGWVVSRGDLSRDAVLITGFRPNE